MEKAWAISDKDYLEKNHKILQNISCIYYTLGNYNKAKHDWQQGLELTKKNRLSLHRSRFISQF